MFREFYFLKRPDSLWVLPSPLLNRYQSSCPELALFVCEVDRLDLPINNIIIIFIQLQLGWNPVVEVCNTYTTTV
jgi:hypothetical protein